MVTPPWPHLALSALRAGVDASFDSPSELRAHHTLPPAHATPRRSALTSLLCDCVRRGRGACGRPVRPRNTPPPHMSELPPPSRAAGPNERDSGGRCREPCALYIPVTRQHTGHLEVTGPSLPSIRPLVSPPFPPPVASHQTSAPWKKLKCLPSRSNSLRSSRSQPSTESQKATSPLVSSCAGDTSSP